MMVDLFKVEESSGGCGGELSEVPTTGGCPLLGVPTYLGYLTPEAGRRPLAYRMLLVVALPY
jgi:hypothetical protein